MVRDTALIEQPVEQWAGHPEHRSRLIAGQLLIIADYGGILAGSNKLEQPADAIDNSLWQGK